MNINRVIQREMEKSNGKVRIVKVPKEKRPTEKSLNELEREIKAQIDANKAMMERAWRNANNR